MNKTSSDFDLLKETPELTEAINRDREKTMSETKNPQDFADFLESLKVNNDGPKEINGWRFDTEFEYLCKCFEDPDFFDTYKDLKYFVEYLLERCRRAESNAKPSDLAEQVKAFMRAGMDAQSKSDNAMEKEQQHYWDEVSDEFRRLSEPE